MRIGKIKSTQTKNNGVFSGMDIEAEYLDQQGRKKELTFHYALWTNDVLGQVMRVLNASFTGKPTPKNVSEVKL